MVTVGDVMKLPQIDYLLSANAAAYAAACERLEAKGLKVYRVKRGDVLYIRVVSTIDNTDPRWKEFRDPYAHHMLVQKAFGVECTVTSASFSDRMISVTYRLSRYLSRQAEFEF